MMTVELPHLAVELDGEAEGGCTPFTVDVAPQALRIMVPRS